MRKLKKKEYYIIAEAIMREKTALYHSTYGWLSEGSFERKRYDGLQKSLDILSEIRGSR